MVFSTDLQDPFSPFFLHPFDLRVRLAQDPAGWFAFFDEDGSGYLERQLLEKAKLMGET